MSRGTAPRVGVVGYGQIGRQLVRRIQDDDRLELAFVHNRTGIELTDVPADAHLGDLSAFASYGPDLIVEAAHPVHTEQHASAFLRTADYLPLSTSALVDDDLRAELFSVAEAHGRCLFLPRGALVGLDALVVSSHMWESVTVTFTKHPAQIETDRGRSPVVAAREVLFNGSVREIATRFPRNVNSMVTLALATVGLDRCAARIVADPDATTGRLEIEARGRDRSVLRVSRDQPMVGVSGTEMFDSLWASVSSAAGLTETAIRFV